jgi:hypothetical protein
MMKNFMLRKTVIAILAIGALFVLLFYFQHQEGPAERAGKKIDIVTEKVGDKIEQTGEKIQDAAKGIKK